MSGIIEAMRSWPWAWAWCGFFLVALLRGGATYLIGRGVAAGVIRWRAPAARTRAVMERVGTWGAPVVALSFLTVGVQTIANLSAGLIEMRWPRYLSGLVPGAAAWATVWSTIGMAAFYALLGGVRGEPLIALAGIVVVVAVVVTYLALRKRAARLVSGDDSGSLNP